MVTIKKKDINKYSPDKKVDELVDADGSPIEGDKPLGNDNEISTPPQQTSDEFATMAIQPNRLNRYGYAREGKNIITKGKFKELVEDVINKEVKYKGIVNKNVEPDANNNSIPDIDEMSADNPGSARHTETFVNDMNSIAMSGEDKGIMLNYIMSNMDLSDIPVSYKNILKRYL